MRYPTSFNLIDGADQSVLWSIRAGQNWSFRFKLKEEDGDPEVLSGRRFRFTVRQANDFESIVIRGTHENGMIRVVDDPVDGWVVDISLKPEDTIPSQVGIHVYAITEVTASGQNESLLEGSIEIKRGVGQ